MFFTTVEKLDNDDNDTGAGLDVYQRSGGTITLVSGMDTAGPRAPPSPGASADGSRVFFTTTEALRASATARLPT